MARVVTFGELMLKLSPEGYLRFTQAGRYIASYGGSEANVAVSLAAYGDDAAFVSKLPEHDIGSNGVSALRARNVDTSMIIRGGERVGVYFAEKGASLRPGQVIYDRKNSAIALSKVSEYDWKRILEGADWFHFSDITPALGGEMVTVCAMALMTARSMGIKTSCDVNYRRKLWSRKKAGEVMSGLLGYVDLCMIGLDAAEDMFGIKPDEGLQGKDRLVSAAGKLAERFGFQAVAMSMRSGSTASFNTLSGMLYTDKKAYFAREYGVDIIDRIGGGDAFDGGLIHMLANGAEPGKAIEFAVASDVMKHTIEGDFNYAALGEVTELAEGGSTGGIRR